MLINLRNALMTGKRLPYDAEVEYLESTGTQWIETGIIGGSSSKVEISASSSNTAQDMGLFGSRNASFVKAFTIWQRVTNTSVRFDFADDATNRVIANAAWDTSGVNTVIKDGPNNTLNGVAGANNATATFTCEYPFYLFSINTAGAATSNASARVYSCKIWQNGVLVRDFIPVRKGTVGYLYDRVTGKLFGNAGTGDFVLGPDVVPVEYIEGNNIGVAVGAPTPCVVDTGIVPNLDTDVWECDAQFVAFGYAAGCWGATGNRFAFGRGSASWNDWYYGYGDRNNRTGVRYDNLRHVFRLDAPSRQLSIDGTTYSGTGTIVTGYNISITIFNRNGSSGVTYLQDNSLSRMYSSKYYRSGSLIQHLVPIRVGTDATSWEGATMDVLTRRIYRNAGTGAFTYGNDLKYPIPAE